MLLAIYWMLKMSGTLILLLGRFSNKIIDIAPSYHIDIFSIVKFISRELNLEYKVNL